MYNQVNIQNVCLRLPEYIAVLFTYLGTNTDYIFVQPGNLFLEPRRSVFTARCESDLLSKVNSVLKLWLTEALPQAPFTSTSFPLS
jgi:hypothetical protein